MTIGPERAREEVQLGRLARAAATALHVQKQLGHHSPAFTLEIYGHFIPEGDRRAVDALDGDAATTRNPGATKPQGMVATRS